MTPPTGFAFAFACFDLILLIIFGLVYGKARQDKKPAIALFLIMIALFFETIYHIAMGFGLTNAR